MVVNIGQVRQQIKPKADSTLRNMRKDGLIAYIRTLEHNYNVAVSFNENQARYIESLGVTVHKLIPVSERLTENGQQVICYHGLAWNPKMTEEICHKGNGRPYGWSNVTHWMPFPEPPKEVFP